MLLNIFKTNQRIASIGVVLLSFILWIPGYFKPSAVVITRNTPLTHFFDFLSGVRWLDLTITSFLIAGQALFLNYLINSNKLLKSNSYVTAFFYVLLNGASYWLFSINAIVFANTFLLLALYQVFRLYNLTEATAVIFNAGLFLGLAILIYPPLIVVFPLLWIALSYLRSPKAKDFLVAIAGLLVPFVYWLSYLFFVDKLNIIDMEFVFRTHMINEVMSGSHLYFFYLISVILLMAVMSSFSFLSRIIVRTRKLFISILLMMLLSLPVLFFNQRDYMALFLILIPSASIVISNFILGFKKKWLGELLVLLILGSIASGYFL